MSSLLTYINIQTWLSYLQVNKALGPAIFTASGNQGNRWISAQVKLSKAITSAPFQLVFEGVVGASWQGDIAIDDVTVQTGAACTSAGDDGGKCNHCKQIRRLTLSICIYLLYDVNGSYVLIK